MKTKILNTLICSKCRGRLSVIIYRRRKERVLEGELKCQRCRRIFPIKNEIACFTSCVKKRFEKNTQKLRKNTIEQEISKKWMTSFSHRELMALYKEWEFMLSVVKKDRETVHLDFATGTGRFLRNIVSRTKGEVVALDNGYGTCLELLYLLKKIRKYKQVSIVCANARNMPFRDNTFDSVSSWAGLDEPNIKRAIKEVYRVLKPRGYFIASGLHYLRGSKSFFRAQKHHIDFLTKEMIIESLRRSGFRNIKHKIFFEGRWNERGDYLPVFGDWYISYALQAQK